MKPTRAEAEEAAAMLGIGTWDLHVALRGEAVATMKRAAQQFASYEDMMSVRVSTTKETRQANLYETWDAACGAAVRAALEGATTVVISDVDGIEYGVGAWPKEDNS